MKDCCSSDGSKHSNKKTGSKETNWASVALWSVIGILLVVVFFTVISGGSTHSAAVPATQAAAKTAASSYDGMVGGC
jgi:hypothetical protein